MIFIGTEIPANEKIFTLVNLELADVFDCNIRLKPQMFPYLTDEERQSHARGLEIMGWRAKRDNPDYFTNNEEIADLDDQAQQAGDGK